MIKTINYIILAFALFAASIFASFQPINWFGFVISISVMVICIFIDKRIAKKRLESEDSNNLNLQAFLSEIILLKEKADFYHKNIEKTKISEIENVLSELFPDVENYRLSLTNEVNINNYSKIISVFAKAERKINRAVSATIDGYETESKKYFGEANEILSVCIDLIKKVQDNGR